MRSPLSAMGVLSFLAPTERVERCRDMIHGECKKFVNGRLQITPPPMPPVASHPCPMPDAFERSVPVQSTRRSSSTRRCHCRCTATNPVDQTITRKQAQHPLARRKCHKISEWTCYVRVIYIGLTYSDLSYVTNDDRSCAIWRTCVRGWVMHQR